MPLGDQVLVDLQSMPSETAGGLLLPTVFQDRLEGGFTDDNFVEPEPRSGLIVAVGPGAPDDNGKPVPVTLKVGQKVVVGPTGGQKVMEKGKSAADCTTFLFREEEIWTTCD